MPGQIYAWSYPENTQVHSAAASHWLVKQAVIKYFSYFERGTEAKILLQEFVFHDGSYPPLKMHFSPENIHYFLEITYFPKELKQNYQKIHHPSKAYCEIHI